jgi:hypothetical protein
MAAMINLLGGATDPNGDPLTVMLISNPAHGTLQQSGSQWIFTPADGYTGPDSFVYVVTDGAGATSPAATATFNIM